MISFSNLDAGLSSFQRSKIESLVRFFRETRTYLKIMKNIFNESDYTEIRLRIEKLSHENLRSWGSMNIEEMIIHCTVQLKLALGEISFKQQGPSVMRSRLGKWILFSAIPWPKGVVTPNEMNREIATFSPTEFEYEKTTLLNYIESVKKAKELKAHPFFGELKRKEWGRVIYKHLDHHLKQFGSR